MTDKETVPVTILTALELAIVDPFLPIEPGDARTALAQLCRVDDVDKTNQPRAISILRPHLLKQFPWLPAVGNRVVEWVETLCEDCTDDDCAMKHKMEGLQKLFGDPLQVEPLIQGAYVQLDDPQESIILNLDWYIVTHEQIVGVPSDDTIRQN